MLFRFSNLLAHNRHQSVFKFLLLHQQIVIKIMKRLPLSMSIPAPQEIDFNSNALENIRQYRIQWSHSCRIAGLDQVSKDMRLSFMYLNIGRAGCDVIKNLLFTLPEQERQSTESILSRLKNHFLPLNDNNMLEAR